MPETKVKTPDGNEITVRHPKGASQDEIIAYAKQHYNAAPNSAQGYIQQDAEQMPWWEAALIGTGKKFHDLASVLPGIDGPDATTQAAYDTLQQERPITTAVGETLPFALAAPATMGAVSAVGSKIPLLGKLFGPAGIGTFAGEGALMGAIDPTSTAATGAVGGLVGKGISMPIERFTRVKPANKEIADFVDAGFKLGRGDLKADVGKVKYESFLHKQGYGGLASRQNQKTVNQLVAKSIGQEELGGPTTLAIGRATKRAAELTGEAFAGFKPYVDNRILQGIASLKDKQIDSVVNKVVNNFQTTGPGYRQLLGALRSSNKPAAQDLADFLQETTMKQLSMKGGGRVDKLLEAIDLEKRLSIIKRHGVTNKETGDVNPNALLEAMHKVFPEEVVTEAGKSPMAMAARAGARFPNLVSKESSQALAADVGAIGMGAAGAGVLHAVAPDIDPALTMAIGAIPALSRRGPSAMYRMLHGAPTAHKMHPMLGQYASQVLGQFGLPLVPEEM